MLKKFLKYEKIVYNIYKGLECVMKKYWKSFVIALSVLVIAGAFWCAYIYQINQTKIEKLNICQDDELIGRLIEQNINPFSKFKFIKKRNADCNVLLINNREDALKFQRDEYCSLLDSSSTAIILLVNTYVHEMYDRENASMELGRTTPLMTPYNYCPQYMDNMINLIKMKKRLGL